MKRWRILGIIAAVSSGVFLAGLIHQDKRMQRPLPQLQEERYIVVVIPSYNNSRWYHLNLAQLFEQHYTHYHVIYIDDCSQDGTYELVRNYIAAVGQGHRVTLIKNEERRGALYNLYHAIHNCPDYAIIVTLDGDDWFKHPHVLERINKAYADSIVVLTYGQYEEFPRGSLGICREILPQVIQTGRYRSVAWCTSHVRTFYAGLFKKIKQEDLMYEGNFFNVTWDQAFMFPMLEMAYGRIKFIPEILYVYNQANPLNDFKIRLQKQLLCERIIRGRTPYQPLSDNEIQTWKVI